MIFRMFRRNREEKPNLSDPDLLWSYPLYVFVEKKEPFSQLDPPDTKPKKQIRNLCIAAGIGYILLLYYALIEKSYGEQVAQVVRNEHDARLNAVFPGFGQQNASLLALLENGLELASRSSPQLVNGVELPPEFYIANYLLFSVVESPFYGMTSALTERNGLPSREVHEAAFDIAEYLVWNRDKCVAHFTPFLQSLTIDARDLEVWLDRKLREL